MYDVSLVMDILDDVIAAIEKIKGRTALVKTADDFLADEATMILLDSICMQLIAIGQGIKDIDRITDRKLLLRYPQIPWRNIAGIRDVLSHNYFNLNAETVFGILGEDLDALFDALKAIKGDLK